MIDIEELLKILKALRPDINFEQTENLMTDGIIDSLDIVVLVGELKDKFDVNITAEHLLPENFDSMAAISALVDRLREK